MKDDHPLLTPNKPIRKIKFNVGRNHKPQQKSTRKDAIDVSTMTLVSEDSHVLDESSELDSSSISTLQEVSEDSYVAESTESLTTSLSPFDSPSSVHGPSSGITILSSTSSSVTPKPSIPPVGHYGHLQSDSEGSDSLEVELVVRHLQQIMLHSLSSADQDVRYKKLLDALIDIVIKEFCSLPVERYWYTEVVSRRSLMVFLSLIFWLLVVSAVLLFSTSARSTYSGPPPT